MDRPYINRDAYLMELAQRPDTLIAVKLAEPDSFALLDYQAELASRMLVQPGEPYKAITWPGEHFDQVMLVSEADLMHLLTKHGYRWYIPPTDLVVAVPDDLRAYYTQGLFRIPVKMNTQGGHEYLLTKHGFHQLKQLCEAGLVGQSSSTHEHVVYRWFARLPNGGE